MPLPVERSQGSVSALVARFQTAAAHNAATAQREASRRSSSSSSTSNTGVVTSEGAKVVSAGNQGWRAGAEGGGQGAKGAVGQVGQKITANGEKMDEMEVLKDDKDENGESNELVEGSVKEEAKGIKVDKVTSKAPPPDNGKASPDKDSSPVPVNTSKPKIAQNRSGTPRKAPTSSTAETSTPFASTKTAPSPSTTSRRSPVVALNSRTTTAKDKKSEASPAKPKIAPASPTTTKSTKPSRPSAITPSVSASNVSASTTKGSPTSATTKTNAMGTASSPKVDRKETNKDASQPPTSAPRAPEGEIKTVSETTPSKTSIPKPKTGPAASGKVPFISKIPTPSARPSSQIRPPSAFKQTKPLIPSTTGPSPSRHPTSIAHSQNTPTPAALRPQLTGTPSKPTASSLAKARSTSTSSESPATQSLGRSASKRTSLGLVPPRQARAGSESPVQSSKMAEGSKGRMSGSSSLSRLLQGTAASRAKAVEGLPGSGVSPVKKGVVKGKDTVSKSEQSKDVETGRPAAQAALAASSQPADSTDIPTDRMGDMSLEGQEQEAQTSGIAPLERQESTSGEGTLGEANGDADTSNPDIIQPVGLSPIGRIGLGAAHPLNDPPVVSDVGQHPVVIATPDAEVHSNDTNH